MASKYVRIHANMPNTVLQKKLFDLIGNKEVMRETHRILGEMCNDYVPMKSGELRKSMHPYPQSVVWTAPYARYQYEGEVWGPNKPVIKDGVIVDWEKGEPRYPTGRELGVQHEWLGWKFGYTTPGTGHHWFDKAMENGGRRTYSLRVTNMLKAEAKKRNKTW